VLQRGEGGELRLEAQELLSIGEFVAEDLDGLLTPVGHIEDAVNRG